MMQKQSLFDFKKITSSLVSGLVLLGVCSWQLNALAEDAPKCRFQNYAKANIEIKNGAALISSTINDQPAQFLMDTGLTTTMLLPSAIDKFGLVKGNMNGRLVEGVSGEARQYYAQVQNYTVAGLKGGRHNFLVIGASSTDSSTKDGVIGVDFLFQDDLEIDFANKVIKFFKPLNCKTTTLSYWGDNAQAVEMQKVNERDFRDIVMVEINGKKLKALIDTGATQTALSFQGAQKLGITPQSEGVTSKGEAGGTGDSGRIKVWQKTFDQFTIGSETIVNPVLNISDLWGALDKANNGGYIDGNDPELLLGADFFAAHHILFSHHQNRFYFSFNGGKLFNSTAVSINGQPANK